MASSILWCGAPLQNKLTGAAYVYNGDGTLQRTLKASPETFAKFGSAVSIVDDLTHDGRPDVIVGAPDHTVNDLANAGEAFVFRGNNGKLFRQLTSDTPKADAGYGYVSVTADLTGRGTISIITGVPLRTPISRRATISRLTSKSVRLKCSKNVMIHKPRALRLTSHRSQRLIVDAFPGSCAIIEPAH